MQASRTQRWWMPLLAIGLSGLLSACAGEKSAEPTAFQVPVEYHKLDNGLKLVLSPDHTAPTVVVAVYYNIGFRIEPEDRTGFAHLFEHMMFQGSESLGKMEFIRLVQLNGGVLNGSTRFDFTNYYEIVPAHKLETILWAEADRMRSLAITQANLTNQQGVVTNEVKVNVLNDPYGGFPWLDLPQVAFTNWYNAHNFYGDLEDLEAAELAEVQAFFDQYYTPDNAALALVGDFEPNQALAWVEKYFGEIPAGDPPPLPDLSEPRQQARRTGSRSSPKARRPALAIAFQMPERNSPEYFAMGLLDQILLQGDDSLLHQRLVKQRGLTGSLSGGINAGLGNMFNYNGPMLWHVSLYHDTGTSADQVLAEVEDVLARLESEPLDQEALDRALVKMRSELYDVMGGFFGFGRADLLASFALFDDDPARINRLEEEFRKVTPELLRRTAREYLKPDRMTTFSIDTTDPQEVTG